MLFVRPLCWASLPRNQSLLMKSLFFLHIDERSSFVSITRMTMALKTRPPAPSLGRRAHACTLFSWSRGALDVAKSGVLPAPTSRVPFLGAARRKCCLRDGNSVPLGPPAQPIVTADGPSLGEQSLFSFLLSLAPHSPHALSASKPREHLGFRVDPRYPTCRSPLAAEALNREREK